MAQAATASQKDHLIDIKPVSDYSTRMARQLTLSPISARLCVCFVLAAILNVAAGAQRRFPTSPTSSGGLLSANQARFDVIRYDLAVRIFPDRKALEGSLLVEARVLHPMRKLLLDLDRPFTVSQVDWVPAHGASPAHPLSFERLPTQLAVNFPETQQPGELVRVRIEYAGQPREAPSPPWVGGFVWSQTADGSPWIAVACQVDGADLWWPCKDHVSDEPETMDLHITVPESLTAAANGTLRGVVSNPDGSRTFHWHIANPINIYNVSLNIAPYKVIEGTYLSVSGERIPMALWVLPENESKGAEFFPQMSEHLRFLEERLGPYPFRSEKYGVAEVPYLGMEHQTVIAYGNHFQNNEWGFDWLHFHELAHEWWGNLVTATDWNDYWIHEGFASLMDALFLEHKAGPEALRAHNARVRERLRNADPVAPRESRTTVQKYFAAPDYTTSDGDVNAKGGQILLTLRYLIGDELFYQALRRFAYPDRLSENLPGRCQCRFATTEDFRHLVEDLSDQDLSWFFEAYLRQAELPELKVERIPEGYRLSWTAASEQPFSMPVEISLDGQLQKIPMPNGQAIVRTSGSELVADPNQWILRKTP